MAYMSPPDGTCNPHWFSSGATLDYFALFFLPTMGIQEQKPSSDDLSWNKHAFSHIFLDYGLICRFFESLPMIWRPSGAWYEVTTAVSSPCSAANKLLEAKCEMTIAPVDSGICLKRFSREFHDPKVEVYHIKPYVGVTLHKPSIW